MKRLLSTLLIVGLLLILSGCGIIANPTSKKLREELMVKDGKANYMVHTEHCTDGDGDEYLSIYVIGIFDIKDSETKEHTSQLRVYRYYTNGRRFKFVGEQDISSNEDIEFLGFYKNDEINIGNALSDYVIYEQGDELLIRSLEDYAIGFFVDIGRQQSLDEYINTNEYSEYWEYDSETMDLSFQEHAMNRILDNLITSSNTSKLDGTTYEIVVDGEGEISLEISKD